MGIPLRTGRTKEIETPEARSVAGLLDGGSGQGRKDPGKVAKSTAHCGGSVHYIGMIIPRAKLREQYLVTQSRYGNLNFDDSQCCAVHVAHKMPPPPTPCK